MTKPPPLAQPYGEGKNGSSGHFRRSFFLSAALHLFLAVLCLIAGCITFFPKKNRPEEVLIDFTVAVPPDVEETVPEKENAPTPPEKEPEAAPEPEKAEELIAVAPEKKQRNKIRRSTKVVKGKKQPAKIVTKKGVPKTAVVRTPLEIKGPRLSDEEIRKLLSAGARPSDHTSIPEREAQRLFVRMRDALYRAWIRPDASVITKVSPEVRITLGAGGIVSSVRLEKSSGNRTLDDSALSAARSVTRFPFLTPAFLRENKYVTITFALHDE